MRWGEGVREGGGGGGGVREGGGGMCVCVIKTSHPGGPKSMYSRMFRSLGGRFELEYRDANFSTKRAIYPRR